MVTIAMKPLTHRQRTVLDFVGEYCRRQGFPPTLREIGEGIGLQNISAVRGHVTALLKKGYITKEDSKARSIRIVHSLSVFSKIKRRCMDLLAPTKACCIRSFMVLGWQLVNAGGTSLATGLDGWTKLWSREPLNMGGGFFASR
jgi:SOS-response transcriptional repressor LexA